MNVTLLLIVVVISSFVIGRISSRFASRYAVLSGAEYLLVGVLLGPHVGLDLIRESTLDFVRPFISLLLGLTGFLVGLQGRDAVKGVRLTLIGFGSALGVIALSAVCLLSLLVNLLPSQEAQPGFLVQRELWRGRGRLLEIYFTSEHLWLALCIGAAAAVTSSVLIDGFRRVHAARGPVTDILRASARASQVTAIIVLGLVLATTRATAAGSLSLGIVEWGLAAIVGSVVCGLLFGWFIGTDSDPSRIFLASVGLVTFASGAGAVLAVSPLFVNLVAGLTVATTSAHAQRLRDELGRLQHVLFVLLMIFAGTMWAPVRGLLWLLPVGYVVTRLLARRLVTAFWLRLFHSERVPRVGSGFWAQGTLSVAIAVDFSMRYRAWESVVLTTVLLGTLLSELFSQRALRRLLADAGELGHEGGGEASDDAVTEARPAPIDRPGGDGS